jgi:hypothetical protein
VVNENGVSLNWNLHSVGDTRVEEVLAAVVLGAGARFVDHSELDTVLDGQIFQFCQVRRSRSATARSSR